MQEHIQYDFIYDNHFSELREMEMMTNRLQIAGMAEPYLGKYFSVYQVRNRLLGYTDGEIKEIDKQIAYERNVGIIPDPNAMAQMQMQQQNPKQGSQSADIQGEFAAGDMDMSGDAPTPAPGGGGSASISAGGAPGGPTTAPM